MYNEPHKTSLEEAQRHVKNEMTLARSTKFLDAAKTWLEFEESKMSLKYGPYRKAVRAAIKARLAYIDLLQSSGEFFE